MGVYQSGNLPGVGRPWTRWQDWINAMLGVWLFLASWVTQRSGSVQTIGAHTASSAWIVGLVLIVVSLTALALPWAAAPEWINAIAGLWLFLSPWVIGPAGPTTSTAINDWAIGVVVVLLALSAMRRTGSRSAPPA